jgi:diguanylate cyclase (GGDEF)-like protein/PAS domain S-box-containing protein
MPILQHLYSNDETFKQFLKIHQLHKGKNQLVQVVTESISESRLTHLHKLIKKALPKAIQVEAIVDENLIGQSLEKNKIWILVTPLNDAKTNELTNETQEGLVDKVKYLSAHYRSLFDGSPNLVYTVDTNGTIKTFNPAVLSELGYLESDLLGKTVSNFIKYTDRDMAHRNFIKVLRGETRTFKVELCDRNGHHLPYLITNIPIKIDQNIVGIHGIGVNQLAQKEANSTIAKLAYHDAMTGLANRILFEKSLNYLTAHAKKQGERLAVIFLDIDRFKTINDTVGHFVGDHILKLAVERIQLQLHGTQLLSRFEGDKFSILIPHIKSRRSINHLVDKIKNSFAEPLFYDGKEYFLSVSMGISVYPVDGTDDETLMKNADIALYSAKVAGDNNVFYYHTEMNDSFYNRIEFEAYLRKALTKEEFCLYYQPQICVDSGKVIGCEALIRWRHPKMGIVSPVHFIPLAEEIGLIEDIGFWVLRRACQQIKTWQTKGIKPFPVSVNVSVRQFLKRDFVGQLRKIIVSEGIDPKYIHLEITESTTLRDIQYSIELVNELKRIGVCVSLDDFGTGYSALNYLKDFSIDILKIDRSFVNNLKADSQDGAIVKAIIMMCQGLSLRTVAEGVETQEQLNLLKGYGCNAVQGFFYSKPLPNDEFEHYIETMANPA